MKFSGGSTPAHCPYEFEVEDGITVSTCAFSESYADARDKFRKQALRTGAELTQLLVYSDDYMNYTIDVAVIKGKKNEGLVVHTSGVHGVEAYAGSPIQIETLKYLSKNKVDPTVVLVHAVNPYGMAKFRRFNENNVDLNRNSFLTKEEWSTILNRPPNIAGYDDFDNLLNPVGVPTFWDIYFGVWFQSLYHILVYGLTHMKRAMVSAQYHKEGGIFFGGKELQSSHAVLYNFMESSFSGFEGKVTWVDVHTGLGKSGQDTLLPDGNPIEGMWEKHFPGANVQFQGSDDGDVASGYELAQGFAANLYERIFKKSRLALFFSQEFGTLPGIFVARAMVLENAAFHFARKDQPYFSTFTRDAFYVRTHEWRQSILKRGMKIMLQSIAFSSGKQ